MGQPNCTSHSGYFALEDQHYNTHRSILITMICVDDLHFWEEYKSSNTLYFATSIVQINFATNDLSIQTCTSWSMSPILFRKA